MSEITADSLKAKLTEKLQATHAVSIYSARTYN